MTIADRIKRLEAALPQPRSTWDLTRLSDDELRRLKALAEKSDEGRDVERLTAAEQAELEVLTVKCRATTVGGRP